MGRCSTRAGLALLLLVALQGCTSPAGTLPMTHALAHRPGAFTVGAMVTGSELHHHRGEPDGDLDDATLDEPLEARCAENGGAVSNFRPATDPGCMVDWQAFGLRRGPTEWLSYGAVIFSGGTTAYGGGLMVGAHLYDSEQHALTVGGALGLVWLGGGVSYSYRPSERVALFFSPEYRATSESGPRISGGTHVRITGGLTLSLEAGLALRESPQSEYSYRAAHVGLGLMYVGGARPRARGGPPDWDAPWRR